MRIFVNMTNIGIQNGRRGGGEAGGGWGYMGQKRVSGLR